ncbi:response regulator transcription factor [Amycolatopsis sp. WAC 04182]|uniref:response regulator transcription factor n=1 Tax=Amycolatopsis sp. WAC 04182 TaxID=2203198 RepID=UPI0013157EC8|nr:helix-turn-helix transcriptional regulator [Amycolatopsis sp. WAC 04182]
MPLSPTELEVLQHIAQGRENREIAEKTFRSTETIRTHVKSILYKFKARNRAHAVAIAYHVGIFQGLPRTDEQGTSPLKPPAPDLTVQIPPEHPAAAALPADDPPTRKRTAASGTPQRPRPTNGRRL